MIAACAESLSRELLDRITGACVFFAQAGAVADGEVEVAAVCR
jgi:hypothetical protein